MRERSGCHGAFGDRDGAGMPERSVGATCKGGQSCRKSGMKVVTRVSRTEVLHELHQHAMSATQ
eukprot:scaffold78869_cov14-Tisochrysis_lutea.AAC.1